MSVGNRKILIIIFSFLIGFIFGINYPKTEKKELVQLMLSSSIGNVIISEIEMDKEENDIVFHVTLNINSNKEVENLIKNEAINPRYETITHAEVYTADGTCIALENSNEEKTILDFSKKEKFELYFLLDDMELNSYDDLYAVLNQLSSINIIFEYKDPNSSDIGVMVASHVFN